MSRTVKILLTVSLLLNLLLAGALIGQMCHTFFGPPIHNQIAQISNSLPQPKRERFDKIMQGAEKDADEMHEQFEHSRQRAAKLLKAQSFDRKAFLNQAQDIEQLHAQFKHRMALAIADAASDLNSQERATMADLLRPPAPPQAAQDKK